METYRVERVNPTSEKPKFGRGTGWNETKGRLDSFMLQINDCHHASGTEHGPAGEKYNTFINSVQSCYDIVNKNRRELSPGGNPASYAAPQQDADYDDDEA